MVNYFINEEVASSEFKKLSYFHLANYLRTFEGDTDSHQFKDDSYFEDALNLYYFAKELRALLFTAIQSIEIAIRSRMIDSIALTHGAFWFADEYLATNKRLFAENLEHIRKELFYIIGAWAVQSNPDTWSTKIPVENLGLAPVPSPEGSDPYQAATLDGWVICKGAANPEGVALFAECTRLANTSDDAIAIADKKAKEDFQWSDELIAINKEINELARKYPVVDLATGVSTDVASLTTDGGSQIGLRAAFHGVEWATNREEIADVVDMLVKEVDDQLTALS